MHRVQVYRVGLSHRMVGPEKDRFFVIESALAVVKNSVRFCFFLFFFCFSNNIFIHHHLYHLLLVPRPVHSMALQFQAVLDLLRDRIAGKILLKKYCAVAYVQSNVV